MPPDHLIHLCLARVQHQVGVDDAAEHAALADEYTVTITVNRYRVAISSSELTST